MGHRMMRCLVVRLVLSDLDVLLMLWHCSSLRLYRMSSDPSAVPSIREEKGDTDARPDAEYQNLSSVTILKVERGGHLLKPAVATSGRQLLPGRPAASRQQAEISIGLRSSALARPDTPETRQKAQHAAHIFGVHRLLHWRDRNTPVPTSIVLANMQTAQHTRLGGRMELATRPCGLIQRQRPQVGTRMAPRPVMASSKREEAVMHVLMPGELVDH